MNRNLTGTVAIRAALSATCAIGVAAVLMHGSANQASVHHVAARTPLHLAADSTATSYPEVGLALAAATLPLPPAAPQAASADAVMSSLRTSKSAESARGLLGAAVNSPDYTVVQRSVTETMPESGTAVARGVPFDAWVVTITDVSPVSMSGGPLPAGISCMFVGVMSIADGAWTQFFTTC